MKNIIRENFEMFQVCFIEFLISSSTTYPKMSYAAAMSFGDIRVNKAINEVPLGQDAIEKQFIAACCKQNEVKEEAQMNRS
jgi:hypothetical protein